MIVVMETEAPESAIEQVIAYLVRAGCDVHRSSGQTRTILGAVGEVDDNDRQVISELDGVAKVVAVSEPYKLASRRFRERPTVVDGEWGSIGGPSPWLAVEPVGQPARRAAPAHLAVGQVRHAPDSEAPREGGSANGPVSAPLPYEVAAGRPFDAAVSRSRQAPDSIGSLACLSLHGHPISQKWPVVFVARQAGWGAERWITAAERELERGVNRVVLLETGDERPDGTRSFELKLVASAKESTHLPVVVDVPRIAQERRYSGAIATAAVAAGADGVILRAWVGPTGEVPRLAATLSWEAAVSLGEQLYAIGELVRK